MCFYNDLLKHTFCPFSGRTYCHTIYWHDLDIPECGVSPQQLTSVVHRQEVDELRRSHGQLQEQYLELSQQQKPEPESSEQGHRVAQLTQQLQQAGQDLAGQRAKTMALQQVMLPTIGIENIAFWVRQDVATQHACLASTSWFSQLLRR